MKKTLVKIANTIVNLAVNSRQETVGYRVEFPSIPEGWLSGMVEVDMTYTWRKYGLRGIQGVNYFTMGGIEHAKSTRFDSKSKYYQSWAGCYLFKLDSPEKWDITSLYSLALADQESWLRIYGVDDPKSTVVTETILNLPETTIDGYRTSWQTGMIDSFSDVGKRKRHTLNSLKLNIFDYMLRTKNPLTTTELCAIPEYVEKVDPKSFEKIRLSGLIALTEITPTVKVLFYGNGYIHKNQDTFQELRDEILNIITHAKIVKL